MYLKKIWFVHNEKLSSSQLLSVKNEAFEIFVFNCLNRVRHDWTIFQIDEIVRESIFLGTFITNSSGAFCLLTRSSISKRLYFV